MARFALTMVVITALPFAAAVAQTGVELEPATGAAVEAAPAPEPVAAPVEAVPPSPAATAPVVAPIETAPTPVDPDPVKPPAASLAAPLTTPTAPSPAAVPDASTARTARKRVATTKPAKPRAATTVTVVNGREITATNITVLAGGKPVSHGGPLGPKAQATLKLSRMPGCHVTVSATFDGGSVSDGSAIDLCRVKLVRLTD